MSIRLDLAEIRARAYTLWEQRGRPDGNPDADWFEAEQQLKLELDTVSTPLQPLAEKAAENLTGETEGARRAQGRGRSGRDNLRAT